MAQSKKKLAAKKKPVAKAAGKKKSAAVKKSATPKKAAPKKAAPKKASVAKKIVAKAKKLVAQVTHATARATPVPQKALSGLLQPLDNRLLVAVEGASEKTAGGLYIPATVNDRPNRGHVVAKGPGKRNKKGELRPLDVNVGDAILFPEYAGTKITLAGRDLLILNEDEVLAIAEA